MSRFFKQIAEQVDDICGAVNGPGSEWFAVFVELVQQKSMQVWAICDTDGGRIPPKPLCRRVYPTLKAAEEAAKYFDFDPEYYPIIKIDIILLEDEK